MKTLAKSLALNTATPTLIIIASLALATYWAFLVPIFQSPDEDLHADYIFSLYSRGGLVKEKVAPIAMVTHPYVCYLLQKTDGQSVKWNSFVKMPTDYGTKQFYQRLDANAPNKNSTKQFNTNPILMHVYPIGYYAISAIWLGILSHFNHSLSFLFFTTRLFSVLLLGIGLFMSYLTMKELTLPKWQSLLILAIIGFFPLTTFVGSYIQPHNLAFAAISTCFYLSLRWRNNSDDKTLCLLGLALSLLLLAKYQFFLCAGMAISAMIFARTNLLNISRANKMRTLSILLIPSLLAGAMQLFIVSYYNRPFVNKEHAYWLPVYINLEKALSQTKEDFLQRITNSFAYAYSNTYSTSGLTFKSFWGLFGWLDTPLIIFNIQVNDAIRYAIQIASLAIILFTLATMFYIAKVFWQLAKKKHMRKAIYLICANPILNSYFLFVLLILALTIIEYPFFLPQGRQWFPLILPIVLAGTIFAFRIIPNKQLRQLLGICVATCWLIYSLLGSYFAPNCIAERYFNKQEQQTIDHAQLAISPINTPCSIDALEPIESQPLIGHHQGPTVAIQNGTQLVVYGWAIDSVTDSPASAVLFYENNKFMQQAVYGLESLDALDKLKNNNYRFSGFGSLISTKGLAPGPHSISIKVVSSDGRYLYNTNRILKFIIF